MKILTQRELKNLYDSQEKEDWRIIQKHQPELKEKLLRDYEDNWVKYKNKHSDIKPIFNLDNKDKQEFIINSEIADRYNLRKHLNDFLEKSQNSTAGIRAFVDILHSQNPQKMYNDMFLAVLIQAEAEFIKKIHKETQKKLENINPDDFCRTIRKNLNSRNMEIIESIYELKLEDIIPFVKNNPVKLVGGEVRPHTAKFVEMETRILARNGIKVITLREYSDTTTIYMFSYLCYLLGATGATYYTSSHSSNYLCGRKVLAPDGSQILPDVYENYREILNRIINDDIYKNKREYKLKMSEAHHPNILKTLSYDRMAKLYVSTLNATKSEIDIINKAVSNGHKIIVNALNGSTAGTLKPILKELGINESVFEWLYEKESQFFDVGYLVVRSKDKETNEDMYSVEHLGIDTTIPEVAKTIPYFELLKGKPEDTKIYECDPDSDRFVLKQIMKKDDSPLLDNYGIGYYELDDDKILAAPSPNKIFLCLDIIDYELMKGEGIWDDYTSFYIITYVSWRAWSEFADSVKQMKKVVTLVGFKNLTSIQREIENWYFYSDKPELTFKDQLGNKITMDKKKQLRVHCKEEESGGRVAGMNKVCNNILGEKTIAMPEKSAADSLVSELIYSSKLYLENSKNYLVINSLDSFFKKYKLSSKIDFRLDILHGLPQGVIAQMDHDRQRAEMKKAGAVKANFNNFFFSIAKAVGEKQIAKEKASAILSEVMPSYKNIWKCLDRIMLTEELLAKGEKRPEGVLMEFKEMNGCVPVVSEFDFRPSGTDPLKSKIYGDASSIDLDKIEQIRSDFEKLARQDLYKILEDHKISSAIEA